MQMNTEKWTLGGMLLVPFSYVLSAATAGRYPTGSELFVITGFSLSAALFWFVRIRKAR